MTKIYPYFSHFGYDFRELNGPDCDIDTLWDSLTQEEQDLFDCEDEYSDILKNITGSESERVKEILSTYIYFKFTDPEWYRFKSTVKKKINGPPPNKKIINKPEEPSSPKPPTFKLEGGVMLLQSKYLHFIAILLFLLPLTFSIALRSPYPIIIGISLYFLILASRYIYLNKKYETHLKQFEIDLSEYKDRIKIMLLEFQEETRNSETQYKIDCEEYEKKNEKEINRIIDNARAMEINRKEKEIREEVSRNINLEIEEECLKISKSKFSRSKEYEEYNRVKFQNSIKSKLYSENYKIVKRDDLRGPAESFFYNKLVEVFGKYVFDYLVIDKSNYIPDIVLMIPDYSIKIDIEIDEPYNLTDFKPTHLFNDEKEKARDNFFVENKWFVIRFAEEQVVLNPYGCCRFINERIKEISLGYLDFDSSILKKFDFPEPIKRWDITDANQYIQTNHREKYLSQIKS